MEGLRFNVGDVVFYRVDVARKEFFGDCSEDVFEAYFVTGVIVRAMSIYYVISNGRDSYTVWGDEIVKVHDYKNIKAIH